MSTKYNFKYNKNYTKCSAFDYRLNTVNGVAPTMTKKKSPLSLTMSLAKPYLLRTLIGIQKVIKFWALGANRRRRSH